MLVRALTASLLLSAVIPAALGADSAAPPAHPLNTWVRQSPRPDQPAPRLQYEGSGAYDPYHRSWIHFGGHDGIPQGFYLFTYSFDTARWRQHFPNTSPPGVCCIDGSNTFDLANRRFVAFPGGSLGHGFQWSRSVKLKQSNVWLYNVEANRWTNMRPPPYREPEKYSREVIGGLNSGATYDPNHEVTIAFGGQGSGGGTNALFVYDAYSNQWKRLEADNSPEQRDGMGLCYDTKNDCLVMFGSQYLSDERTWIYRYATNRWEAHGLDPHPPGKKEGTYSTNPKMAYDSTNGVCMCIVRRGEESGKPTGTLETWIFDTGRLQWTEMTPEVAPDPSASRARNLSYSAAENLFILESVGADHQGPQLWTYRYREGPDEMSLAPPTGLELTTAPGKATLQWNASESPAAKTYNVYRAKWNEPWKVKLIRLASTDATQYEDAALAPGDVYLYRVAALGPRGAESAISPSVRTQPRVPAAPVVSILANDRIELGWPAHPDTDVVGYNVYRGLASVATVRRGEPKPWRDNDPEYSEPVIVSVRDITGIKKLNDAPIDRTHLTDTGVDLTAKDESAGDYRYAVYAYIVRAVNKLGTESGPSPYALTIPSAPQHVMLRERDGTAELKWAPNPETSLVGYRVYKLGDSRWDIVRLTDKPIREPRFRHPVGTAETRFWIVPVDSLGQEGEPSSAVWSNHGYPDFYEGPWHQ